MNTQTSDTPFGLGFIGAGKLAGSVIRGLLRMKFCTPNEIIASQPLDDLRAQLVQETGIRVSAGNDEVIAGARVILLGVKPTVVLPVLSEERKALRGKLVISLAAGVRLARMETVADARFLRAMTNIPSALGRGATALAAGRKSSGADLELATKIFGSIGTVVTVEEDQIDAVTALAGSGPAFVYSVIEALAAGGVKAGLETDAALKLATQTVLGAAQFAVESGASPEELRRMVITPGGTTAAGLAAMDKHKTSAGLIAAVEAAAARGQEMADSAK